MRMITCLVFAVFVAQFVMFNPSAAWPQDVTTSISLEKSVISQHEPTIIDINVHNSSSTTFHFDPGYDEEGIDVTVVDPIGQTRKRQQSGLHEGMRFSHAVAVAPGDSSVIPVLLNDWFPFDRVGNYQIYVSLSHATSNESGRASTKLVLTVRALDQAELESRCADLVKKIKGSQSALGSIVAARALATVDDPAVVPFLAEAMDKREIAGLMISALARLKTSSAMEALAQAARSNDPETRTLANAALQALAKR